MINSLMDNDELSKRLNQLINIEFLPQKHTILLVDDEENNLSLLRRTFRKDYNLLLATNGKEAKKILEENGDNISLIVSDQRMPEMSGTEFLKIANSKYPDIVKILLTGNTDVDIIISAINDCHLYQYVLKPFEPDDLKNTIESGLMNYDLKNAKTLILGELKELFYTTIKSISSALDAKDKYTHGHSMRVTLYSLMLANALNIDKKELETIEIAGLLHDIGKIGIPESILCKNGKLTDEEYQIICTHPEQGNKMVQGIKQFEQISTGIKYHHEKWNAQGYPTHIGGIDIPYIARIIAIADTYDAMTSTRSYRKALTHEIAIAEIERCAGSQFDPEYAKTFLSIAEEIRKAQQNPDEYYKKYSTMDCFLTEEKIEQSIT